MSVIDDDPNHPYALLTALTYAGLGLRVVPIRPEAKAPILGDWPNRASNDPDTIRGWWAKRPRAGVGLVMGRQSDGAVLVAIDVDNHNPAQLGADTLADLEDAYGKLPDTWRQITGSGGAHIVLRVPEGTEVRNDAGKLLGPGIDIRGDGGQILVEPTIHPNGRPYAWEDGYAPWDLPVADAPAWLVGLLTARRDEPQERPSAPYDGPERPGDRWAAETSWRSLLETDGAEYLGTHPDGHELWARPGIDGDHTSASLYFKGSDVLYVFTSAWPHLEQNCSYTKLGYLAATQFGGDHSEAARWLARHGYGSAPEHDDGDGLIGDTLRAGDDPAPAAEGPARRCHLPEEFWAARPLFQHIRRAAWSRILSADAVFGAVLVRAAFMVHPKVIIPAVVGRHGSLNLMGGIVGRSGIGKGSAADTAMELLGGPHNELGYRSVEVTAGSGEGIVRSFSERVQVEVDGKKTTEYRRTIQGVFIRVDEGEVLGQLGGRNGSTLWSIWRSGWTGEKLGFTNATQERRYPNVEARTYRLCALVGIQPTLAGEILADSDGGTPQRFLWFSTTDPALPAGAVDWPGPLGWQPPAWQWPATALQRIDHLELRPVEVHQAIADELQQAQRAKVAGAAIDEMNSHRGLNQLKVATVLAALDGRYDVNLDDWALAAIVMDTSDAVREDMRAAVISENRRLEERQIALHGRKEAAGEAARRGASADVDRVAEVIRRAVDKHGVEGLTEKEVRDRVASRDRRAFFQPALQVARVNGWIVEELGRWYASSHVT